MKKVGVKEITYNQLSKIIIGATVGVGILSLPNATAAISNQDAWLSVIIGGWYPILVILLGVYIANKHPKENILELSRKYFGESIGRVLGIIFSIQFLAYTISLICGFSNVLRVFIVAFLTPQKVIGIILITSVLGCLMGLNTIGRINELTFYFMILLATISLATFKDGSYLNIMPILGSGAGKIVKASKESGFSYAGVEIFMLIYPFVNDSKKIKSSAYKAVAIIIGIYSWFTFSTIYFLPPDIVPKAQWSFMMLTENIEVPFISNFRFIFLFLWSILIFKTVINNYFAIGLSLNQYIKKISINKFTLMLAPVIFFLSIKYGNEIKRKAFIGLIRLGYIYFNLTYLVILALIIYFKRSKNDEEQ